MRMIRSAALIVSVCVVCGVAPAFAGQRDPVVVEPVVQTRSFADAEDAAPPNADADDPAIWVRGERSVVLGTLKEGGLAAFDLSGRVLTIVPAPPAPRPGASPGRFNNVDVLGDLAVVSDRGRDRVRVFRIDPAGADAGARVLSEVTDPRGGPVFSDSEQDVDQQFTAYGLAAGRDGRSGQRWVAVTQRGRSRVALLRLVDRPDGSVGVERVAVWEVPSRFRLPAGGWWRPCEDPGDEPQLEGAVFDRASGELVVAQEDVGVWRVPVSAAGFGRAVLVDRVREFGLPERFDPEVGECVADGPDPGVGGRWLSRDAEGVTVADGVLVASSQGDSRFVVYESGRTWDFRVAGRAGLDSVEHSDGAAVSTAELGPLFPHGLLVVHDGERAVPDGDGSGFAFLRWDDVVAAGRSELGAGAGKHGRAGALSAG